MSTEKMLPCPFCRSGAHVCEEMKYHRFYVQCDGLYDEKNGCRCNLGAIWHHDERFFHAYATEEEAIKAWNTRAPVSGLREKVDALYLPDAVQTGYNNAIDDVLSLLSSEPDVLAEVEKEIERERCYEITDEHRYFKGYNDAIEKAVSIVHHHRERDKQ